VFKRMVLVAVGAALALSVGAAGAYFTTQVKVSDSVIRAGSVAMSAEPTVAPLAIDALAPGTAVTRPLAVVNDGTLPIDVIVTVTKSAGITDFYEALTVRVTSGDSALYEGPLSLMRTAPLRMAAGSRADLRFEVGLPATVTNTLAEDYVKVALVIDAEQAH